MKRADMIFRRFFYSPSSIPSKYKRNFFLLYCDVGFWGILNGSILTFLSIYAARLGATGAQIGLIGAIPAMVTLALAIPSGRWLEQRPINRAVVWTSIASRFFYLLLVPLPFFLPEHLQIWAIIIITLVKFRSIEITPPFDLRRVEFLMEDVPVRLASPTTGQAFEQYTFRNLNVRYDYYSAADGLHHLIQRFSLGRRTWKAIQ